jgi:DNA-directed RNA polymerase specialized sigma24 family protein
VPNPRSNSGGDPQDEMVRLLAILVRRQVGSQADAIVELHRAGFGPTRIAELLDTTPGTVNVAINRYRAKHRS